MKTLRTTKDLKAFCDRAHDRDYVTVDTEFLRERTYYSKLCLVQLAIPGDNDEEDAVLVDPLEDGLSLDPLYDLFRDESVVKVFHAARQDLEIFYFQGDVFPTPLFDTQVAAMVCGFGEQVGYENACAAYFKNFTGQIIKIYRLVAPPAKRCPEKLCAWRCDAPARNIRVSV